MVCHYNFQLVANTLRGHRSPSALDFLRRRTAEALSRANRLAARVVELGGRLPTKVPELVERATDKPSPRGRRRDRDACPEFLTATVRNEEEIERLIGDSAPTMTGA